MVFSEALHCFALLCSALLCLVLRGEFGLHCNVHRDALCRFIAAQVPPLPLAALCWHDWAVVCACTCAITVHGARCADVHANVNDREQIENMPIAH